MIPDELGGGGSSGLDDSSGTRDRAHCHSVAGSRLCAGMEEMEAFGMPN